MDPGYSRAQGRNVFTYETYFSHSAGREQVSWEYRDKDGELHKGIARTLKRAITAARKHGYPPNIVSNYLPRKCAECGCNFTPISRHDSHCENCLTELGNAYGA